jgi:outer membrane protein TolC
MFDASPRRSFGVVPQLVVPLIFGALTVAGCRSVDPSPQLSRAADAVEARLGARPAWGAGAPALRNPLPTGLAIERALQVHPTIGARLAAVEQAEAQRVAAERLPNPSLTAALGIPIDGDGGTPGGVGLTAPITALLTRPDRIATADAELRREVLALADLAHRLAEETVRGCITVHHLREQVALDDERTRVLERLALLRADLERRGEGTGAQLAAAMDTLGAAREKAAASRKALALAEASLLSLLGGDDPGAGCPAIDASTLPPLSAIDAGMPELTAILADRLDVAAAIARVEAHGARVETAELERLGAIAFSLRAEENFVGRQGLFPGIRFELPILDPGDARIATARAAALRAVHEAEEVVRLALLEVRRATIERQGDAERLAHLRDTRIPAAEEHLRLQGLRRAAGEGTELEVLAANLDLILARRTESSCSADLRTSRLRLARAVGEPFARANDPRASDGAVPRTSETRTTKKEGGR